MLTNENRSLAEVVQNIVENVQDILRSEVRLAKAEIGAEAQKAASAGKILAAGVVVGLYSLGILLLGAVYALSRALPPWEAAMIVGGVLAIVALILVITGRGRLKNVHAKPVKTIRSVEENVEWLKKQTR